MKEQIRMGVFETNSSSVHSLTMCTEAEYEAWKRGELLYRRWERKFVKTPKLTDEDKKGAQTLYEDSQEKYWKDWEQLTDSEKNEWYILYCDRYDNSNNYTYDRFWSENDYETFEESFNTPGGEKIIAFGYYGYN